MRNFSATSIHFGRPGLSQLRVPPPEHLPEQSAHQVNRPQHKMAPLEVNNAYKLVRIADSACVIVLEIILDLITIVESATIGSRLTLLWKQETENKSDRHRLL